MTEDGAALFDFTKRTPRRYPKNTGLGGYHVTCPVEGIREPALKLLRHVGYQGLAHVEFKHDEVDAEYKLIECNGRFVGHNSC